MLLLRNCRGSQKIVRKRKSIENILLVLGWILCRPSDLSLLLHSQIRIFCKLLFKVDLMSNKLRWWGVILTLFSFECFGASAVYRLSLSLLCMFFILMLLMVCRNKCAMIINEGLFFIKYVFVVCIFIAFLWVPNSMFIDYADASKYISIFFMVLQVNLM